MKVEEKYIKRFEKLITFGETLANKNRKEVKEKELLEQSAEWITNCLSAIENISSKQSVYYEKFSFITINMKEMVNTL